MADRSDPFDSGREEENALLAALVELHRRKQRAQRTSRDNAYARVLEHFEQRGKRLRGELLLTEELIERSLGDARKSPQPQTQQELEIVGPAGGTASGRFRVQNRTPQATLVELVVGEALSGRTPALRFEPERLELAAAASALVRVVADLQAFREPGSCTIPIECRAGGRRDRLWLIVTATARPRSEP